MIPDCCQRGSSPLWILPVSVHLSNPWLLFIFLIYQAGEGVASPGADRSCCATELSWALATQQPVAQQDQMDGCYHHSHGSFCAHEVPPTCPGHQCLSCIWCCTTCLKHPPATIHAASEKVKPCSPAVLSVCPALSICVGGGAEGITAPACSSSSLCQKQWAQPAGS